MRKFTKLILAACLVASSFAGFSGETSSTPLSSRPNIVFFLVDDMGYSDIGCYGSTFYETPNVDRLAASGVRFTDAYAACPVCSPSRSAIMTGKYPARTGSTDYFGSKGPRAILRMKRGKHALLPAPYKSHMDLSEETLAEALQSHGWKTFIAGKWHLGKDPKYSPKNQGFDVSVGAYQAGHPKTYFSPYQNPALKDGPPGEYLTDRLASETISFIDHNHDKPFFVYFPFYAVHIPLGARPDLLKKYEAKRKALGLTDEFTSEGAQTVRMNQSNPVYAAMVEAMDQAVGHVMDTLKKYDLDKNTIIIFFSDNGGLSTRQGWPTSNAPLRAGKGWMYEGGIREPLIINWPGVVKPGRVEHSVVIDTDFYPTILQMVGLPLLPDQHKDGISLASLLKSGTPLPKRDFFWHYPHYGDQGGSPASAIRSGDWKLIHWYDGNRTELFNLKTDIGEKHDLAAEKPDMVRQLDGKLKKWLKNMNAKYPTPNPNYRPGKHDKNGK